jgi:hypothetical protein
VLDAGDLAALASFEALAAAQSRRIRAAEQHEAEASGAERAGLRGAVEALSGLIGTYDEGWNLSLRRMFLLAINLQATVLRDAAVQLLTELEASADEDGLARGVLG